MKKQIVFVEYVPNMINVKIAKVLKATGNYETVLVSFSKVDKEKYKDVFDKFFIFELSHKINPKNMLLILKKLSSREGKEFIKSIRKLNPYLFQITGPDFFTLIFMHITKKRPKIYFAYDIWGFYGRKFSIKDLGIKESFQEFFERIGFGKTDGILHKGPKDELNLLKYKVRVPDLALLPGCLDEWNQNINLKREVKKTNIHLVHAAYPPRDTIFHVPFIKTIRKITSQKIHVHVYGRCQDEKENEIYCNEEKNNKYFHFHERLNVDKLKKEISRYDYGIILDYHFIDIMNPLHLKTAMGNRLFDYIEAGIPTICFKQSEFMSKIIKENNIGFSINYEDLDRIREILLKKDYKNMRRDIKKAQKNFSLNRKLIFDLEKFYDSVVKTKENLSFSS
ncbi:MAG: hypothetical protein NTU63_01465 [Candidatus Pacearchaeota archaeon]|nr:hypothetical protein [Candidatus Pacearchaeota archaeon]